MRYLAYGSIELGKETDPIPMCGFSPPIMLAELESKDDELKENPICGNCHKNPSLYQLSWYSDEPGRDPLKVYVCRNVPCIVHGLLRVVDNYTAIVRGLLRDVLRLQKDGSL